MPETNKQKSQETKDPSLEEQIHYHTSIQQNTAQKNKVELWSDMKR